MNVEVKDTKETIFIEKFDEYVLNLLSEYSGKECNLMISGGSVTDLLVESIPLIKTLDTKEWNLFYSDERCDIDNLNFVRSLEFIKEIKFKRIHPIMSMQSDIKYTREKMDICLLGIGENGHICSLWPDTEDLLTHKTFIKVTVKDAIKERMTVTTEFLNSNVKNLYFLLPSKVQDGKIIIKDVKEPHESIAKLLMVNYKVILVKESEGGGESDVSNIKSDATSVKSNEKNKK